MGGGPVRITQPMLDVLGALLSADDYELHGWAIAKVTKRAGPTVYKILERLADGGMVTAYWEDRNPDENRPRRRFYHLTSDGAAWATSVLNERRPARKHFGLRPTFGWMEIG